MTITCPSRNCNKHLSATRKAYKSYYKRKTAAPQKAGNDRWHIHAIQKHLLQFHNEDREASDTEIDETAQHDVTEPTGETSDSSGPDFLGFEEEPPVHTITKSLRPQSLKRVVSPLIPTKRARRNQS